MKIYKNDNKVIVELDFWQFKNNPYDAEEEKEETHNLIGVIAGEEMTISQLNDLSYKDSSQEGAPLVYWHDGKDKFIKLCKEIGIGIWEHEICAYCRKPIYGVFTMGDKGNQCFGCELKDDEKELVIARLKTQDKNKKLSIG